MNKSLGWASEPRIKDTHLFRFKWSFLATFLLGETGSNKWDVNSCMTFSFAWYFVAIIYEECLDFETIAIWHHFCNGAREESCWPFGCVSCCHNLLMDHEILYLIWLLSNICIWSFCYSETLLTFVQYIVYAEEIYNCIYTFFLS